MNTRDLLDEAVDLLETFDLYFLNRSYLSVSDQELAEKLGDFMEKYDAL
jgi:hypothetical protein